MKLLILGDDGRTHALVWKLFSSPLAGELVCAPGNGGTGQFVPSAALDLSDAAAIAGWVFAEQFDLIIPADERPLLAGLADETLALQVGVCGPPQRTARLFASRCATKEFLLRHQLPTPPGRAFTSVSTAEQYLAAQPLPLMIKADHPAAGEGVFTERHAAMEGLRDLFATRPPEGPSDGVVVEQFVPGPRAVLSAFADGRTTVPLLATRLYDRVGPGETGAQVTGVGAHTGASQLAGRLTTYLHQRVLAPLAAALAADSLPGWGLLGADCVLAADGPRLTAVRWGLRESEAQVVLPRLEDDLLPWLQACVTGRLAELPAPQWQPVATVGIGLLVHGYPERHATGGLVNGLELLDEGVLLFHGGTSGPTLRYAGPQEKAARGAPLLSGLFGGGTSAAGLRVSGGHPLTVVASGATLAGARGRALINAERIGFDDRRFRDDIAARELG